MTTMKMTVEEWIKVQDNPRQRDTERHALKAKHLYEPQPTHAFVAAAKLPNGTLIKLDGHTRAYMWKRRMVGAPRGVEVNILPVKSAEEAAELYTHYDNQSAVETATDRTFGGFREIGFKPQSVLLRSGRVGNALRLAWIGVHGYAKGQQARNSYQIINEFSEEILALDELQLGKSAATTGIIGAFLLSYRKHGSAIVPFWRAVFANSGTKANGQMDAVQAVNELMLARKGNYGSSAATDVMARALHAVEKWLMGDMLAIIPRPLDIGTYLTRKEAKRAA